MHATVLLRCLQSFLSACDLHLLISSLPSKNQHATMKLDRSHISTDSTTIWKWTQNISFLNRLVNGEKEPFLSLIKSRCSMGQKILLPLVIRFSDSLIMM
jgi:hypothetical protein